MIITKNNIWIFARVIEEWSEHAHLLFREGESENPEHPLVQKGFQSLSKAVVTSQSMSPGNAKQMANVVRHVKKATECFEAASCRHSSKAHIISNMGLRLSWAWDEALSALSDSKKNLTC